MRSKSAYTFFLTDGGVVIGHDALLAGELDHAPATGMSRTARLWPHGPTYAGHP